MRTFWLIVCLALGGCVATSVLPFLALWDVRPDLFLMFALTAAMKGRKDRAIQAAWGAGLAKDLFGHGPLGAHCVLFLLAAAAVINIRPMLNVRMSRIQLALAAAVCAGCHLLYAGALFVFCPQMSVAGATGQIALTTGITALLTPPFVLATGRLVRFLNIAAAPGFTRP